MNILLITSLTDFADAITKALQQAGHDVEVACNPQGDGLSDLSGFDLLVAVYPLQDSAGLTIVRALHNVKTKVSMLVLVLPAGLVAHAEQAGPDTRDTALNALLVELHMWVEVLGRRPRRRKVSTSLHIGDLEINLLSRHVVRRGTPIELTPREFKLLEYLMRQSGSLVTRAMLLEHVWGMYDETQTSIVETEICRLRRKIDQDFDRKLLNTIRGLGYRLGITKTD